MPATRFWCSVLLFLACLAGGPVTARPAPEPPVSETVDELLERARTTRGNDPRLAMTMATQARDLAVEHGLSRQHVAALIGIGVSHYFLGEYPEAFQSYQDALRLAESTGDLKQTADVLNNIGILYFVWGEHDAALDHYLRSLAIRLDMNDVQNIGTSYNNVANIHHTAGEYDQALDYYQRSLEVYEANADTAMIAGSLNNIGLLFFDKGRHNRALSTFARALFLERKIDDKPGMAMTLNNTGQVYEAMGSLDEAMERYETSLALRRDLGDRQGISVCLHNIGAIHVAQGSYELGIDYLRQALALAEDLEIQELIRNDLESLAEAHEQAGNFEQALAYYKRYKEAHDTIFSAERTKQMALAQTRFEVDLKDREIKALKRETEIERFQRQLLLVVAGLAVVIILLLLNRYLFQRRAHRQIARTNVALRRAHGELEQATRNELAHVARVATMGELAAAFAHELNQPLAAIRANARAGRNYLEREQPDTHEVHGALEDIGDDAERAQNIIVRLRDMLRKGEQKRRPVDMRRVVQDTVAMIRAEATRQGTGLELRFGADLPRVAGDRIQLQQVVLNLIKNGLAVMDGREGGLTVTTERTAEGGVRVEVTDAGPPVDESVLTDMFEPFFTTKPDGLGMGLPICRTIMESHGGSIAAERREGGGMTVSIEVPGEGRQVRMDSGTGTSQ